MMALVKLNDDDDYNDDDYNTDYDEGVCNS